MYRKIEYLIELQCDEALGFKDLKYSSFLFRILECTIGSDGFVACFSVSPIHDVLIISSDFSLHNLFCLNRAAWCSLGFAGFVP